MEQNGKVTERPKLIDRDQITEIAWIVGGGTLAVLAARRLSYAEVVLAVTAIVFLFCLAVVVFYNYTRRLSWDRRRRNN